MATLADQVRVLIAQSGLTQASFAERLGMDPTKLSKSLAGKRRFSFLELAVIDAEFGSNFSAGERFAARLAGVGVVPGGAVLVARRYMEARSALAAIGVRQNYRLPEPEMGRGRFVDQGARLAEIALAQVRAAAVTSRQPLWEVIPQAFGVDVAIQSFPPGFDGLAAAGADARLIIAGTTSNAPRQRFTIAHELCHLLASDDQRIHEDSDIYGHGSRNGEGEMRANAFAAAFLMPRESLEKQNISSFDDFCHASIDLGVSPNALAWRLYSLNQLDGNVREEWGAVTSAGAAAQVGRTSEFAAAMQGASTNRYPSLLMEDLRTALEGGILDFGDYRRYSGQLFEGIDDVASEELESGLSWEGMLP